MNKEGGSMANKAGEHKRSFWKNPWWLIAALIAFVWLILALGDRTPTVRITRPAPPIPNAYDYYLLADRQLWKQVDKTTIKISLWSTSDPELVHLNRYSTAQKLAFLAQMAPCLHPIHEGFRYRCQVTDTSIDSNFGRLRDLERYLNFAARTEVEAGHWDAAMQYALNGIRVGSDIAQPCTFNNVLYGTALQAMCHRNVWNCLDHLNTAQAKAALKRLQQIEDRTPTYAAILIEEKFETQQELIQRFAETGWRIGMSFDDDAVPQLKHVRHSLIPGVLTVPMKDRRISLVLRNKQWVYDYYMNRLDRLISHIQPKYQERVTAPPPETLDPLGTLWQPWYEKMDCKLTMSQTQNRMLLVGCALQAYRAEQGAFPPTLQGLTPRYLAKLPDDPFAFTGTFRYHLKGTSYLLYSIGPDGKDDGGKPVYDKTSPMSYAVNGHSTGDIVARVNW